MVKKIELPWKRTVDARPQAAPKPKRKARSWTAGVWEPVAVIVSACAAGIALWQTFILQEQLTAADVNRVKQTTFEAAQGYCRIINRLPLAYAGESKDYAGKPLTEYKWQATPALIEHDDHAKTLKEIFAAEDKLDDALELINVWIQLNGKQRAHIAEAKKQTVHLTRALTLLLNPLMPAPSIGLPDKAGNMCKAAKESLSLALIGKPQADVSIDEANPSN